MARVLYNGQRIIPAPLVSISKNYQKSGNGEIIGKTYSLTLTGTLVAWMGSPYSSGVFYNGSTYPADEDVDANSRLSSIQRKQEGLRDLFSDEGKSFEIQADDGSTPVRCNPRINEISFAEGTWYDRCEYTINLETDELYGKAGISQEDTFLQYISDASEEWSIDTNEESAETLGISKTYAISHTISANGKRFYDEVGAIVKQPWQYARDFVNSKLLYNDGDLLTTAEFSGIPSYYSGYNHVRNENINKQEGSYSITETWVLSSGNSSETFSISTVDSLESPYNQVTINGEVRGYDTRDGNLNIISSKWDNANSKFVSVSGMAFIRAQQFSGLSLNLVPITQTIGRNPIQGLITYDFEYNDRPMTMISGAKSEVISINDNLGGESFASVFVLGRARGPVLQALNTKPASTRSLSIEVVFDPPTYSDRSYTTIHNIFNNLKPSVNPTYSGSILNVIAAANPENNGFTTVFQDQGQENWNPLEGRYSYNTTWTFE